jgi:hypothetical protein
VTSNKSGDARGARAAARNVRLLTQTLDSMQRLRLRLRLRLLGTAGAGAGARRPMAGPEGPREQRAELLRRLNNAAKSWRDPEQIGEHEAVMAKCEAMRAAGAVAPTGDRE